MCDRRTQTRTAYGPITTRIPAERRSLCSTGLTDVLEREGWEVHTQLEDPDHFGPPLEEFEGAQKAEDLDARIRRQLRNPEPEYCEHKRALIVKTSHIGGHKFAGNCIVS